MSEVLTIVLKVGMHCEGCARKVKKSLSGLSGLEELKVDYEAQKVTVKGKLNPNKVLEKLSKIGKSGEILQINVEPQKQKEEDKKETPKANPPPQIQTAVLKAMLHCEGCGRKVKDAIKKTPGVQEVNVNFQQQKVFVKGFFDVNKVLQRALKTGKHVELCPPEKPKDVSKENKGATMEEKKDASKEDKKEASKGDGKDNSKEGKQEVSKEDKTEGSKGEKKDTPKDNKKDDSKDVNKEEKKEMPKGAKKENAKQESKDAPKEDKGKSKDVPKVEKTKEESKNEKKDASKDEKKEESKAVVEEFVSPYMPYRCDDATQLFSEDNPNACIII